MSKSLSICVSMTAYNGQTYLLEQLKSIENQVRRPDLVLISDDGSTDQTLALLNDFAARSTLNVRVVVRDRQDATYRDNFQYSAAVAEGDIVVFCDQDDLWDVNKLARLEEAFGDPSVQAVIHAYSDFRLRLDGSSIEVFPSPLPDATFDGQSFEPILNWVGMSLAVRRECVDKGIEIARRWEVEFDRLIVSRPDCFFDHWSHMHDLLFLNVARMLGRVRCVATPLALHRLHDRNVTQTKIPWKQADDLNGMWGTQYFVNYKKIAAFSGSFADFIETKLADLLPQDRVRCMADSYRRWEAIYTTRYQIHARSRGLFGGLRLLATMVSNGAYRDRMSGGLGWRSLVRDSLATAGIRVGA